MHAYLAVRFDSEDDAQKFFKDGGDHNKQIIPLIAMEVAENPVSEAEFKDLGGNLFTAIYRYVSKHNTWLTPINS